MFKVCLLAFEADWAKEVSEGLNAHGLKCRRARLWDDAPINVARHHMFEEVVWDFRDAASVQNVIQGCNYLVIDAIECVQRHTLSDAVMMLRALCDGARQGGADRIILLNSAGLMPREQGALLSRVDGVYLPRDMAQLLDHLLVLELELYRYAADAMHTNALHTGMVIRRGHVPKLPKDIQARVNVIGAEELIRMLAVVTREGRAGLRYLVGGVNTDAEQWRAATTSRSHTTPLTTAQNLALAQDQHLDVSLAVKHLGHQPQPSLNALLNAL